MSSRLAIVTLVLCGAACSLFADLGDLTKGEAAPSAGESDGAVADASVELSDAPALQGDASLEGDADATPLAIQTIAQDEPGSISVAANATDVFWVNESTHIAHSLARDGGSPQSYTPSDAGIAYLPRSVLATNAGAVVFVPAVQPVSQSPCLTYLLNPGNGSLVCGIYDYGSIYNAAAVDTSNLYLLADDCYANEKVSCILRQSNSATTLVGSLVWKAPYDTNNRARGPLVAEGGTLFFFTLNAGTWWLRSVPAAASNAAAAVIAQDSEAVQAMGVDSTSVYWITTVGTLRSAPRTGTADAGIPAPFTSHTFKDPIGLAVGSKAIFVTDKTSVSAISKTDGSVTVLAEGEAAPSGITISPTSPTRVLWANAGDGTIRSLSIP